MAQYLELSNALASSAFKHVGVLSANGQLHFVFFRPTKKIGKIKPTHLTYKIARKCVQINVTYLSGRGNVYRNGGNEGKSSGTCSTTANEWWIPKHTFA